MTIRSYVASDEPAVIALWSQCGLLRPWNNPQLDIARKSAVQPDWFLVFEMDSNVVGTAMVGYDGHRGWVNYLAVHPDQQGAGIGRALMARAESVLSAAGCPKLNLQVRSGNAAALDFYRKLGYDVDAAVSMGKRLIADDVNGSV